MQISKRNPYLQYLALYETFQLGFHQSLKPILEQDDHTSILSILTYQLKIRDKSVTPPREKKKSPEETICLKPKPSVPKCNLKRTESAIKKTYPSKLKLLTFEQLMENQKSDRPASSQSKHHQSRNANCKSNQTRQYSPQLNKSLISPQSTQDLQRSAYIKEKERFLKNLYLPDSKKKSTKKQSQTLKKEKENYQKDTTQLYGLQKPFFDENYSTFFHDYYFQKYINPDTSIISAASESERIKIPIFDSNDSYHGIKIDF